MIKPAQIKAIMPAATATNIATYSPLLATWMPAYLIYTPIRQAAFLAQIAHESGQLRYVREIADGSTYEGRKDLGNQYPGDGVKFKGRGLIQITGRANYKNISTAFDIDFIKEPALLELPTYACRSACWWWEVHNLNELADKDDMKGMTRRINGGLNGFADRMVFYARAKKVFGIK